MRKLSLSAILVLFVSMSTTSVRGCGGRSPSPPPNPNLLNLYTNEFINYLDHPFDNTYQPFEASMYGEKTQSQAGTTGTYDTASGNTGGTTFDGGVPWAFTTFGDRMLPAKWRFKTTGGLCNIFAPEKPMAAPGLYRFTCPLYVINNQVVGWDPPTAVSVDDSGDVVIDTNNIGEQLNDGNQFMHAGDGLLSGNGEYSLVYLSDGNLVEFDTTYRMVWMSWTFGTGGGDAHVHLQDGDLVIYDSGTSPVFTTSTGGHSGAYMVCQNDGNIVIYDSGGTPLWASGVP
jgi:hypothetical protein